MDNVKPLKHQEIFVNLQQNMLSKLEMVSASIDHAPSQGAANEGNWLKLFQDYLPRRYQAASGFVIDSIGGVSDQIDIIVFDRQFTPFIFNHEGIYYVPAESVYAVIEVKPELSAKYIKYAAEKAESVRKLYRTSVPIPHAGGMYPAKLVFPIAAGIIAPKSSWSPAFGDAFEAALKPLGEMKTIEFGCALADGAFEVTIAEDGQYTVNVTSSDTLLSFFMGLLARLQLLGTVPAIDYKAYGSERGH